MNFYFIEKTIIMCQHFNVLITSTLLTHIMSVTLSLQLYINQISEHI